MKTINHINNIAIKETRLIIEPLIINGTLIKAIAPIKIKIGVFFILSFLSLWVRELPHQPFINNYRYNYCSDVDKVSNIGLVHSFISPLAIGPHAVSLPSLIAHAVVSMASSISSRDPNSVTNPFFIIIFLYAL